MRKLIGAVGAMLFVAATANAQDGPPIIGMATVVDADGIRIGTASVMLWGVESVERPQACSINGQPWACFAAAVRALETIASVGEVTCTPMERPDGYGRILAVCLVNGVNINEALV